RLASELTGWELNVMTVSEAEAKSEAEARELRELFMKALDVDEEIANILVQEGFSSIEEVAYVPAAELLEIEEFDEGIVEELRSRARDYLATRDAKLQELGRVADDLRNMEGMDDQLLEALVKHGIRTMEDLAEQSIDDLLGVGGLDEERAAALIMKAREPWFADQGGDA